jgi:hypothetical protein
VSRGGDQVAIAQTAADLARLAGDRAAALRLARPEMLLGDGQEEIARLDGLAPFLVEEALTSREPSRRGRGLAEQELAHADPECAPGGAGAIARVPVGAMGALQHALELRLAPDQERRRRQPLEVRRAQRGLAIGQRQELVGVLPRAPVVRAPAALQGIGRHATSIARSGQRSSGGGAARPGRDGGRDSEPGVAGGPEPARRYVRATAIAVRALVPARYDRAPRRG